LNDFDREWRNASPARNITREPDTPVTAEARLQRISEALEANEEALLKAADDEVEAEEARDAAERRWRLSAECPQAGVYEGVRITVAYVDAWVRDKIAKEDSDLKRAIQARKAAEAQRRRLEGQLRAAQSVNSSVRESYRGTGRYGS
jgi:hypothetical protein